VIDFERLLLSDVEKANAISKANRELDTLFRAICRQFLEFLEDLEQFNKLEIVLAFIINSVD